MEKKLTQTLGSVSWTIDVNPNAIYVYAAEGSYGQNSLGSCLYTYGLSQLAPPAPITR